MGLVTVLDCFLHRGIDQLVRARRVHARDGGRTADSAHARRSPAPDFNLPDITGQNLRLSARRGRVTLLSFWGTWSRSCRLEIPGLERLHLNYGQRGLDVVGIAVSEPDGATGLTSWCSAHHVTYRQMLSTPELQEVYGDVLELPVTVLIDKKSRIRYRWNGERDYATFQAAVERLVAE